MTPVEQKKEDRLLAKAKIIWQRAVEVIHLGVGGELATSAI